jgi:cyclic pyranopterin phosphate synthase
MAVVMSLPIVDDLPPRPTLSPRGRLAAYSLRVSVLEQCQLDCRYCRPGSMTTPTEKARWLTPLEHGRLARAFLARGVKKVRFTGGEPTLRADLVDIVAAWQSAAAGVDLALALTTNGLRLPPLLPALRAAGLHAVTIHLDTLRDERVEALMGPGASVALATDATLHARECGLQVKINMVVQRGGNDDELVEMLDRGRELGAEVRFIEQMNTGSAAGYVKETFIAGRDIVARLAAARGARRLPRRHPSDPAALLATDDGVVFGVIASDTEPFCAACDRLRLSADGRVRGCLYQTGGLPLGAALRTGIDDEGLLALLDSALDDKQSHHPLVPRSRAPFSMADVGG